MLKDYFGGKQFRQSVDPSDVVAYGAAKHAASFYTSADGSNMPNLGSVIFSLSNARQGFSSMF